MAFRSHWRFAAEFCTPGEGHEKGGIEGEGGYFRRNHLVPVPHAADLDALNLMLMTACRADEARILDGRSETVGAAMAIERGHLLSCATEGVDLAEVVFPLVDKQGCVTVKTNLYSVPAAAGSRVEARIHPLHVEIWRAGHRIARHERCHGRRQHVLDLEHYLDVLSHKPGALAGSKPLAQWREAGRWPACYDALWNRLCARHGSSWLALITREWSVAGASETDCKARYRYALVVGSGDHLRVGRVGQRLSQCRDGGPILTAGVDHGGFAHVGGRCIAQSPATAE